MASSPSGEPIKGWDFFDRVYCISLKERTDRRRQAEAQFAAVGLSRRVEYVLADRHPENSEMGIFQSHLECMARGLASGADRILIFEDDVVFRRFSADRLETCIAFLEAHPGWKAFFLGCLVRRSRKTGHPWIRSVAYRSLAHAYAVHRPFAETIAAIPWKGIPYDTMLSLFDEGFFVIYPSIAFQGASPSDNDRRRRLDRFRRWCGGLERIQKIDEWRHRYSGLLIAAHVFGLMAILVLVLLTYR
jgi:hypothetical protein